MPTYNFRDNTYDYLKEENHEDEHNEDELISSDRLPTAEEIDEIVKYLESIFWNDLQLPQETSSGIWKLDFFITLIDLLRGVYYENGSETILEGIRSIGNKPEIMRMIKDGYFSKYTEKLNHHLYQFAKRQTLGKTIFRIFASTELDGVDIAYDELCLSIYNQLKNFNRNQEDFFLDDDETITPQRYEGISEHIKELLLKLELNPISVKKIQQRYTQLFHEDLIERLVEVGIYETVEWTLPNAFIYELENLDKRSLKVDDFNIELKLEDKIEDLHLIVSRGIPKEKMDNHPFISDEFLQLMSSLIQEELTEANPFESEFKSFSFRNPAIFTGELINEETEGVKIDYLFEVLEELARKDKVLYDFELFKQEATEARRTHIQNTPKPIDYNSLAKGLHNVIHKTAFTTNEDVISFYSMLLQLPSALTFSSTVISLIHLFDKIITKKNVPLLSLIQQITNHPASLEKLNDTYISLFEGLGFSNELEEVLLRQEWRLRLLLPDFSEDEIKVQDIENESLALYSLLNEYKTEVIKSSIPLGEQKDVDQEEQEEVDLTQKMKNRLDEVCLLIERFSDKADHWRVLTNYFMLVYGKSVSVMIEKAGILNDISALLPFPFVNKEYNIHASSDKKTTLKSIIEENKRRAEQYPNFHCNGSILQNEEGVYYYLLAKGDTLEAVSQSLCCSLDSIQKVNNWESIQLETSEITTSLQTTLLQQEQQILLPYHYNVPNGVNYYQSCYSTEKKDVEFMNVKSEEEGTKTLSIYLSREEELLKKLHPITSSISNSKDRTGVQFELRIQIYAKLLGVFKINASRTKGLSTDFDIKFIFSFLEVDENQKGNFDAEALKSKSFDNSFALFNTLNGSFQSLEHFLVYLQLILFQHFGEEKKANNEVTFLLSPEEWDKGILALLSTGYHRKVHNTRFVQGSSVIEGLKETDLVVMNTVQHYKAGEYNVKTGWNKKSLRKILFNKERRYGKEKNIEQSDLKYVYMSDLELTDGSAIIEIVNRISDFSGKESGLSISIKLSSDIEMSLEEVLKMDNRLFVYFSEYIQKRVSEIVKQLNTHQNTLKGCFDYLVDETQNTISNKINSIKKAILKGNNEGDVTISSTTLITYIQLRFEGEKIHLNTLSLSVKGELDYSTQLDKMNGSVIKELKLIEYTDANSLKTISSIFNKINSDYTFKHLESEKQLESIKSSSVDEMKLLQNKPFHKLLKVYGLRAGVQELDYSLLQLTINEWEKYLLDYKRNDNIDLIDIDEIIHTMVDELKQPLKDYAKEMNGKLKNASWSRIKLSSLNVQQCEYYLGSIDEIVKMLMNKPQKMSDQKFYPSTVLLDLKHRNISQFLFKVLNGATINQLRKPFAQDILFPLFIEQQVSKSVY
ncbi:hypothetical protein [Flammeovirga aprica]|uniref:Uncharacterized protein n=1 Tax=Flammeovirga aprica JL-4 TaxID=694437 RepID=A0A7X9RZG3_9BACT|nr:hypothetical protein [Flammeovirga aprica]NME71539.1 hypothetical protein [Flammeovirga aprica JL-4]